MTTCFAQASSARRATCSADRWGITHLNPAIDPAGLLREARAIRPDVTLAERFKVYQL